ncbi:hypothetical protein [Pontibacillus litoralis]|uniref:Uncharacterized protein n=1 Tax=Pontibacillus litoralis JSM 072002 TaxID=1385512 RepID=A0A0A5G4P2_9BACI|nr:hypothetical protein [Pontibacillus litoralis]KGX86123.1 hypothetical protein N784_06045 [Pontibacillus litoralis JSM 072002]
MKQNKIERGQAITFRIPSDTPDHVMRQLQQLKETERRNFSSTIARYVVQGVSESTKNDRETISIPLPKTLTKAQRDWLKHEYSEALLGSILYQLISDPVRSSALLASLNSNALNIDDALYLQETERKERVTKENEVYSQQDELSSAQESDPLIDDLDVLSWESMNEELETTQTISNSTAEDETLAVDDFLGSFLDKMNK